MGHNFSGKLYSMTDYRKTLIIESMDVPPVVQPDPRIFVSSVTGLSSGCRRAASAGDVLYVAGPGNAIAGSGNANIIVRKLDSNLQDMVTPIQYGDSNINDVYGLAWNGSNLVMVYGQRNQSGANRQAVLLDANLNEVTKAVLQTDVYDVWYDAISGVFRFVTHINNHIGEISTSLTLDNVYLHTVEKNASPLSVVRHECFYVNDPNHLYLCYWVRDSQDVYLITKIDRTGMSVVGSAQVRTLGLPGRPIVMDIDGGMIYAAAKKSTTTNSIVLWKFDQTTMALQAQKSLPCGNESEVFGVRAVVDGIIFIWNDSGPNYSFIKTDSNLNLLEEARVQGLDVERVRRFFTIIHQNMITFPFIGDSGNGTGDDNGMIIQTDDRVDWLVGKTASCAPNLNVVDPNRAPSNDTLTGETFVPFLNAATLNVSATGITQTSGAVNQTRCNLL